METDLRDSLAVHATTTTTRATVTTATTATLRKAFNLAFHREDTRVRSCSSACPNSLFQSFSNEIRVKIRFLDLYKDLNLNFC